MCSASKSIFSAASRLLTTVAGSSFLAPSLPGADEDAEDDCVDGMTSFLQSVTLTIAFSSGLGPGFSSCCCRCLSVIATAAFL